MYRLDSTRIRVLVFLGSLLPGIAAATPILSIDADPGQPGIQSTRSVAVGSSFDVLVWIEEVEAAHPLHAFELVLSHGAASNVSSVTLGAFLGAGALLLPGASVPGGVEIAATRIGPGGSSGAGALAIVHMTALALGSASLDPLSVLLSEPFGVPLAATSLQGATIQVVPEAGTAALLLAGLLAIATRRR